MAQAIETMISRIFNPNPWPLVEVIKSGEGPKWRLLDTNTSWFNGIGNPPTTIQYQLDGNMYLDSATGNIWQLQTGTWVKISSSTTPGGSNTDVQINNNGAFYGDAGFTYTIGSQAVVVGGSIASPVINATTGFRINGAAASNHVLLGNGTNYVDSATIPAGSLTPAGSDTQVQVNSGNALYADSGFTYNHATGLVTTAIFKATTGVNTPEIIDAATQAGADFGAQINNAITALPAGGGYVNAINFTGTQTMTTAVTIPANVVVLLGAYQVNVHASFTMSGQGASIIGLPGRNSTLQQDFGSPVLLISGLYCNVKNIIFDGNGQSSASGLISLGNGASYSVIEECQLKNWVQVGLAVPGGNNSMYVNKTLFTSAGAGTTTGPAVQSNGGSILVLEDVTIGYTGAGAVITNSAGAMTMINVAISNSGGGLESYLGSGSGTLSAFNSSFSGNSVAGHPAISVTSPQTKLYNCSALATVNNNACQINAQQAIVVGCHFTVSTNGGGIGGLVIREGIGGWFQGNTIDFDAGATPTSDVYGIWLQATNGTDFLNNTIRDNIATGNNTTKLVGFFHDNSFGNGACASNTWDNNAAIDLNRTIRRAAGITTTNIFRDFSGNSVSLYDSGGSGSSADTIIQVAGGQIAFANLPTPLGNGSQIYVSDATNTNPIRSGGTGTLALRLNGAWSGAGSPEVVAVDLTNQQATITTTTLYAVPATGAGQYRLNWDSKITVVAGSSSTLGPLTIVYTDPDGVAQTITCGAQLNTGAIATSSAGNLTTTVLLGLPILLNCKASTNITYAFTYASNAATVMRYNLHLQLELM